MLSIGYNIVVIFFGRRRKGMPSSFYDIESERLREAKSQALMSKMVFWIMTAFCLGTAFLADISSMLKAFYIAVPIIVSGVVFSKKIASTVKFYTEGIISIILVTVYGVQGSLLGSIQGAFLACVCMTALCRNLTLTKIQILLTTIVYAVSTPFFPDNIFCGGVTVNSFVMRLGILYIGMAMIAVLISWNNRQVMIATQKTQNVEYLLQVVEIKKNEAEAAAKAKSDFLANMSHEIRTPMNAVCGMSELMDRSEMSPQNAEYLESIRISAGSLLSIINDILDFSKIDAGKMELSESPYSIASTVNDIVSMINSRLTGSGAVLTVNVAPDLPAMLIGDEGRVRQILINLLGNAVKFTEQGRILLDMSYEKISSSKIRLIIKVADTGIGIRPEEKDRLFTAFTQADAGKSREGTGLGLVITRRLAEMMGGDVTMESEYGRGTTFTVNILQRCCDMTPCFSDKSYSGGKCYIYESNRYYRESLRQLFASLGAECVQLTSPSELSEIFKEGGDNVRLFFDSRSGLDTVLSVDGLTDRISCMAMVAQGDAVPAIPAGRKISVMRKPITLFSLAAAEGKICGTAERKPVLGRFRCPEAKILIVDDNDINLKVAKGFLEPYGAKLTLASGGMEAVNIIRSGEEFDLVFMDHMMPDIDGVAAAKMIRKLPAAGASVPIVALTANAIKGVEEMFISEGMNGFLAKPIDSDKLCVIMQKFIPKAKQILSAEPAEPAKTAVRTGISVSDIDADKAAERLGGEKIYRELLTAVCDEGEAKSRRLEKMLAEEDFKNYLIEVHSLKSTAANIGAQKLSERAAEHEAAAKSGNYDFIRSDGEQLIAEYRKLIDEISPYAEKHEHKKGGGDIGISEIHEKISAAADCIDRFDTQHAEQLLDELMGAELPDSEFGAVTEASDLLGQFMYDEAKERLESVL